jgi:hypothetical protein
MIIIVSKDEEVLSHREYPIQVVHTFPEKYKRPFLCEEVLYVSDSSTESHYRVTHPNNRGRK